MTWNPDEAGPAGLYVHIPFCSSRCRYCDFHTTAGGDDLAEAYVEALEADIRSFPSRSGYRPGIASVYLGGGTPSKLDSSLTGRILRACRGSFQVGRDAEVTIECNPESLTREKLEAYARFGINRLSIGLQSSKDEALEMMGRPHRAAGGMEALSLAREAGFENISGDFVYGLPGQSAAEWAEDLEAIAGLGLAHVSAYMLETEKDTPLARDIASGALPEPEASVLAEQWAATGRLLGAAGSARYEISNFARPGRECRHNLAYWTDGPFLGFGASAHGYWRGRRTAVGPGAAAYVEAVSRGAETMEVADEPDPARRLAEAVIMGLRLEEGCDFEALSVRYGLNLLDLHADVLEEETRAGRMERRGGRVRLTAAGILHANDVLCRFV